MTSWLLTIPAVPPSANVLLRLHWSKRKRLADQWAILVAHAVASTNVPKAKGQRRATVVIHRRRLLDIANLYLGLDKLVFDRLVDEEILVDDSPRWFDFTVR